jgi:hypothetical protein
MYYTVSDLLATNKYTVLSGKIFSINKYIKHLAHQNLHYKLNLKNRSSFCMIHTNIL